jgi:WXXGXW repeat (2 copies)
MKIRIAILTCAVLFGVSAFAVPSHADHSDFSLFVNIPALLGAAPPPPPPAVVVVAPPPPPVVVAPPPRVGLVWVPGFWDWDDGHYVWRAGRWEPEHPGFVYAPATWVQVGGGWRLTPGHWVRGDDGPHGPPHCPPGLAMQGRC